LSYGQQIGVVGPLNGIYLATLLRIITVGSLTTGKNKNREKYGEIAQNPPHFPGRNFTSAKPLNFQIAENTKIAEIKFISIWFGNSFPCSN